MRPRHQTLLDIGDLNSKMGRCMCNRETGAKKIENGRKLLELEYIIRNPLNFVRCNVSRGKNNLLF